MLAARAELAAAAAAAPNASEIVKRQRMGKLNLCEVGACESYYSVKACVLQLPRGHTWRFEWRCDLFSRPTLSLSL